MANLTDLCACVRVGRSDVDELSEELNKCNVGCNLNGHLIKVPHYVCR